MDESEDMTIVLLNLTYKLLSNTSTVTSGFLASVPDPDPSIESTELRILIWLMILFLALK